MQVGKAPPAIPAIRADLLITLVVAGWVMSLFNATSAVLGVTAGIAGDRVGHRSMILGGLACLFVGCTMGGVSTGALGLLLGRLVEGIGFVAVVVAAPSLIAEVTGSSDNRLALSAWSTYMPAGIALMMLITPPLLATLGWRGLWLVNSGLIVVFAIVFAMGTRRVGSLSTQHRRFADVRIALSRQGTWLLAACFATYALQFFGLMSWLPTFLVEKLTYSSGQAAIITAFVVALNIVGNLLAGRLLQRGVPRWCLLAFASGTLGVLALGVFAVNVPNLLQLAMAAAFSIVGGLIPSSLLAAVLEHSPSPAQVGTTNGILVQGSNIGSFLSPPAFAFLVTHYGGWSQASWLLLIASCVGVGLAIRLHRVELLSS